MRMAPLVGIAVFSVLFGFGGPALSQTDGAPVVDTSWLGDGAVIASGLTIVALARLLPDPHGPLWQHQLLHEDDIVKDNFSSSAAHLSDVLVTTSLLTPLALQLSQGWNGETAKRGLVYGETVLLTLALNDAVKRMIGRPRPYMYSSNGDIRVYANRAGGDGYLSFYSGHAATAFASAISGAYLYSQSTNDVRARTAVWAGGLLMAGAAANLRIRAGKHFYSDVVAGALVGGATGFLVPWLHLRCGATNTLSTAEWVAIAAAPLAGVALSQLVPLVSDVLIPVDNPQSVGEVKLVPFVDGRTAGVMVTGRF